MAIARGTARERQLTGNLGTETVRVPRALVKDEKGHVTEWRPKALPAPIPALDPESRGPDCCGLLRRHKHLARQAGAFGHFEGAVRKDVVSRAWRKVKVDWDAWCARSLADEDIIRIILDGTVIKTRIDKNATNISVLAAIGVRRDGQ